MTVVYDEAHDFSAEQSKKRERAERRLWWWNLSMGIMHLIWAIACLALGLGEGRTAKFRIVQTTAYPDWSGGPRGPVPAIQMHDVVRFTALTSGFAWMSAAAHFLVLAAFNAYIRDLRIGINRFRWFEYAASSTLMIVLIAMLFGVWDVHTLFALGSCNACMNFFGYSHEVQNKAGQRIDWSNFLFGCYAGAVPWAIIFSYLGASPQDRVPGFVWAILFVYLFFFLTFPINMVLQYVQLGRWYRDEGYGFPGGGYYFGEKVYQILSLTAKSFLLWLVVGGTNQPNSYTGD